MVMTNGKEVLRSSGVANGMSEEDFEYLWSLGRMREIKSESYVTFEKMKEPEVHVILEGQLNVEVSFGDKRTKLVVAELGVGDIFGELGLLGFSASTASVKSKNKSVLVSWQNQTLLAKLQSKPTLGYSFMLNTAKGLAERLYHTTQKLEDAHEQLAKR